ncbi:MAG: HD domain-containing protein, partial [Clostridia bacterium]|nr:HD domain-containing protein [Clostridia bacterium]
MNREYAERIISEAQQLNNDDWIEHSYNVARLAEKIAEKSGIDSEKAYILGLLHDIGRRNGDMQARHALEGYNYLTSIGFEDGARICLTHTFQ